MILLRYLFLIQLLFLFNIAVAQIEPHLPIDETDIIDESNALRITEELPIEDHSVYLIKHPISINQCTFEELSLLPNLNSIEIQLIWNYVSIHRPLISILELQSIPNIDLDKLRKVLPYLQISDTEFSLRRIGDRLFSDGRKQIIIRWSRVLQKQRGYLLSDSLNNAYLGSPDKLFLRFQNYKPGSFSYGLVAEKDAGEKLWDNATKTKIDYLTAHLFIERLSPKLTALAIGDYKLRIGQGLILDNVFQSAGNQELGLYVKSPDVLKPYNSVQENNMFRGIASKIKINGQLKALLFFSKTKVDANLVLSDNGTNENTPSSFTSIQYAGLHRTKSELQDRNALGLMHSGGSLIQNFNKGYIGLGAVYSHVDLQEAKNSAPYQVFEPSKKNQFHSSVFHQFQVNKLLLFGELASDEKGHLALLQGILKGLGKYAESIIIYRNYSSQFYTKNSQTISSTGKSQNEQGILFGFNFLPNKAWKYNLYYDSWTHPWLRYSTDLPSKGNEWSVKMTYTKRKKWSVYLQYKNNIQEENQNYLNESRLNQLTNHSAKIHWEQKLNSNWTWRSRIEWHGYGGNEHIEMGYLIYQDLIYKSLEYPISSTLRFSIFDTDSYNSRIYAYENDLLYQYYIPGYFGRGTRSYINVRYKTRSDWSFELRFAISYFPDQLTNGSSGDIIEGSYRTEIKLQLSKYF